MRKTRNEAERLCRQHGQQPRGKLMIGMAQALPSTAPYPLLGVNGHVTKHHHDGALSNEESLRRKCAPRD
jgi:hypothetical protein